MTDVLTKEQRHKNMKNIRGKDTRIEVILRKALWNKGYRYRKNYRQRSEGNGNKRFGQRSERNRSKRSGQESTADRNSEYKTESESETSDS